MKSPFRESRLSKGTKAKAARIIAELKAKPPARWRELDGASGAKLFAIWQEAKSQRKQPKNQQPINFKPYSPIRHA